MKYFYKELHNIIIKHLIKKKKINKKIYQKIMNKLRFNKKKIKTDKKILITNLLNKNLIEIKIIHPNNYKI